MQYVAQEHGLGCFIAATAMMLDLTYQQVALTVPLQDAQAFQRTGFNATGLLALDRIEALALVHGKKADSVGPPFAVQAGRRYIAVIATSIPKLNHALAVDETGIAFDPDPINKHTRKPWSEYNVLGLLEFRPLK